jgi:uncharacterized protein YbbC (DUF1343 family)
VLDRPNPAGRPVEGLTLLRRGWESFVGAGPMPMRHGLTLGEWATGSSTISARRRLPCDRDGRAGARMTPPALAGRTSRLWINPSPNAANLNMARAYAGTVMLEGTTLSEGGAPRARWKCCSAHPTSMPGRPWPKWIAWRRNGCAAARCARCWFEPTFHKHAESCAMALMIHAEGGFYDHHAFRPWRLQALAFKAIRRLYPDYRSGGIFKYEYTNDVLAIDVINGGPLLREWVDDPAAMPSDLDVFAKADEDSWGEERQRYLLY